MMRARAVRPNQWPFGSRKFSGTAELSFRDFTACVSPAFLMSERRPMSTVNTKSAGLFAPSFRSRSSMPFLAKTALTRMPLSAVKASNIGRIRCGWR